MCIDFTLVLGGPKVPNDFILFLLLQKCPITSNLVLGDPKYQMTSPCFGWSKGSQMTTPLVLSGPKVHLVLGCPKISNDHCHTLFWVA